jgi:hypothetical protein
MRREKQMAGKLKSVPPPDIKSIIHHLPEEFLMCRSFGHQWNPYTVFRRGREFESVLKCGRCAGLRHQFINANGEVIKGYYTYEAGYVIAGWGNMTKKERAQIRLAATNLMWHNADQVIDSIA